MNTPPPTSSPTGLPPRLLHVDEVEHLLGRSKDWIYDEVEAGRLPALRIGRLLRFDPASLAEWLDHRRTPPAPAARPEEADRA